MPMCTGAKKNQVIKIESHGVRCASCVCVCGHGGGVNAGGDRQNRAKGKRAK